MSGLTVERLAELRRIAEAAAIIADADTKGTSGEQAASIMLYIAEFDPPTVLALLDEIERLRRIETAAKRVRATHRYDHSRVVGVCDCSLCQLNKALDTHKGGDGA